MLPPYLDYHQINLCYSRKISVLIGWPLSWFLIPSITQQSNSKFEVLKIGYYTWNMKMYKIVSVIIYYKMNFGILTQIFTITQCAKICFLSWVQLECNDNRKWLEISTIFSGSTVVGLQGTGGDILSWLLLIMFLLWFLFIWVWDNYNSRYWYLVLS